MYLELLSIPTDKDLQAYPSVHLTSPHEWDPSVLDFDPTEWFQFDPNFDEFGHYANRSLSILDKLDHAPQISSTHNLWVNKHAFK